MTQKTNHTGALQRFGKTLQEVVEFILNPWLSRVDAKPLQEKVYFIEKPLYKGRPDDEQRLESMIEQLQTQLDSHKNNTKTQLEDIKAALPKQVEDVLQQTININRIIRPTVEVLMRELEEKKQSFQESTNIVEIQARQERLQETLVHLEKLTASFPNLEVQRVASLEAGKWLLAHRAELADSVASELLSSEYPYREDFCRNIRQYLKLLGHSLENGIEPRLLYQGIITHQQPPTEIYLQAFYLIRNRFMSDGESLEKVSDQAAEELTKYFNYLIDYLSAGGRG